jgi:transcriptional regulator with XRE-family HTH domain
VVLRSDRRVVPTMAEPGRVHNPGFTSVDVGRLLSRERNRQGLSLRDVATRTGIPVSQLRAAETGVLDRPDGLSTLKTVRRYADLLGLPGDRFALAILERWPTAGGAPHPFSPMIRPDRDAGGTQEAHRTDVTAVTRASRTTPHPGAPGDEPTRAVDAVSPVAPVAWRGSDAGHSGAWSDTGVTPAVVAPADHVRHRARSAPPALQALAVVLALAVLSGVALLAVDRLNPSWLRAVGLTRPTSDAGSTGGRADHAPARPSGHAPSGTARIASATTALHPRTADGQALVVVDASRFTATLSSRGGACWVQVTTNTSTTPAFTGIIDGTAHAFSDVRSLVVEMGSTTGRLSISSPGGHLSTYAPTGAPYRVVVRTAR